MTDGPDQDLSQDLSQAPWIVVSCSTNWLELSGAVTQTNLTIPQHSNQLCLPMQDIA